MSNGDSPGSSVFFMQKEKISLNLHFGHNDDLLPIAGYSHRESHSARKSLVPNKDLGTLSPVYPVETSPQPRSAEQPPTNHLILFN